MFVFEHSKKQESLSALCCIPHDRYPISTLDVSTRRQHAIISNHSNRRNRTTHLAGHPSGPLPSYDSHVLGASATYTRSILNEFVVSWLRRQQI
ncbi:hypothetical protein A0H81_11534 [Grifola frondosa]|uniref:Uncharacterized protein n=1 Tax=Grifola frondosa TaxID=5627 RepID=A0A1C7LX76_GRIFR|nr:hypothetical protein A0H81_11534 [Grifola frondosa]